MRCVRRDKSGQGAHKRHRLLEFQASPRSTLRYPGGKCLPVLLAPRQAFEGNRRVDWLAGLTDRRSTPCRRTQWRWLSVSCEPERQLAHQWSSLLDKPNWLHSSPPAIVVSLSVSAAVNLTAAI